jgi:hypothetical protein
MSSREEQPFRFCCQSCGSPIDIIIRKSRGGEFHGAKQLLPDLYPFDDKTNFVDLHLDFPVAIGKYVVGKTPFMEAAQRIGYEELKLHGSRLAYLTEEATPRLRVFTLLLKLFRNGKWTPFKTSCRRNFDVDVKSDAPQDRAAALYNVISKVMMPFAFPGQDAEASHLSISTMHQVTNEHPAAIRAFMAEIIGNDFLKNLQNSCLDIYPKILEAELPLRPVLFLDFDEEFANNPIPLRISNEAFESYKDLYKDISEIVSRQFVLVAGINNLLKRGDHNAFKPGIGQTKGGKDFTPKSLHDFADIAFGKKLGFIDDSWFEPLEDGADNQLRNAIAHVKTDYDEVNQVITYYPRLEGMNQAKPEQMTFIQFMRRLLQSYRELRRLNHLIKGLFYLQYLVIDRDKPAADAAKG